MTEAKERKDSKRPMLHETYLNLNKAELPSGIAEKKKSERALAILAPLFTSARSNPCILHQQDRSIYVRELVKQIHR
jgi:hypothetical protein